MGELGSIRCVARYSARMGQCFSNTYDTLRLEVGPQSSQRADAMPLPLSLASYASCACSDLEGAGFDTVSMVAMTRVGGFILPCPTPIFPLLKVCKEQAETSSCPTSKCVFSTYLLQGYQVVNIPDVKRYGQVLSDGVGRISQELAQGMAARLGRAGRIPAGQMPSTFQIRFAGVKGMVTVHPPLKGRKCAPRLHAASWHALHT